MRGELEVCSIITTARISWFRSILPLKIKKGMWWMIKVDVWHNVWCVNNLSCASWKRDHFVSVMSCESRRVSCKLSWRVRSWLMAKCFCLDRYFNPGGVFHRSIPLPFLCRNPMQSGTEFCDGGTRYFLFLLRESKIVCAITIGDWAFVCLSPFASSLIRRDNAMASTTYS